MKIFLRAIALTFAFLFLFFLLTLAGLGVFARQKLLSFASAAQTSLPELITMIKTGWQTQPPQTDNQLNILVLGIDKVANRGQSTTLTDTMMIVSLNLKTVQVSLLSLPRDLWLPDYQTKINALYVYGQQRNPQAPEKFPVEVLQQLTGIPIHRTLIIDLDTLAELVNEVGGITIDIPESFTDTEFPRSDVDLQNATKPQDLYKTVSFEKGNEVMSGERVLEYIRSRHAQGDQGDDQARAQRQQVVIMSLMKNFQNPRFYVDVQRLGRLYLFYQQHFVKTLSATELIGLAHQLWPLRAQLKNIKFSAHSLSIFPADPAGVITHPRVQPNKYQGQWVYEIKNPEQLKQEVQQKMFGTPSGAP